MQDSITLSAAPQSRPCLEGAFGNPASVFSEEVPASPTHSFSSMSTLSSVSDLDSDSDSEYLPPLSEVKSEVVDSRDNVLENMGNVIHSLPPEKTDPPQKVYQKSRARGVDVCADIDTVEAFRVARAIAAIEDSAFSIIGSRELRSSSKPNSAKKTLSSAYNGDNTKISRKKNKLSINTGSGATAESVTSSAAIEQDYEHIQNEEFKPYTTIYSSPNKSHTRKRKVEIHNPIQQPDHTLSLENPAPPKKSGRKRFSRWAWVEIEDAETSEPKVQEEGLSKEPAKRPTSLPPDYSAQQFSFRASYLSNSDKDMIRQSRALSEGADKPRDPRPIVPTITRKNGILANTTITSGRLRPRKEPSTSNSHKSRKSASDFTALNNKFGDNGAETSTASSSRARPLAGESGLNALAKYQNEKADNRVDITNRLHVEPDAGGETAAKVTTYLDHGSEILTPKRQKLNSGAKSVQNCGDQVVAPSPISVISSAERFGNGVFTLVNGIWMIPKICHK